MSTCPWLALADAARPAWVYAAIAGGVLVFVLFLVLLIVLLTRKPEAPPRACGSCRRAMLPSWDKCMFCGWKPEPGKASIEFIAGPMSGQTLTLNGELTTVGSIGGNSVVLSDPAVSRKHLGIKKEADGFQLVDFGSTNGVYVNGQRVGKRKLSSGDVIRVGTSEMVFRVSG